MLSVDEKSQIQVLDRSQPALERVLLEERASEVRRMAAYALSRMSNQAASGALEAADFDRSRTTRAVAESALTRE